MITRTITTTTTFSSRPKPNSNSLSQRVHEFEKTARYTIKKLMETRENIEAAANNDVVEHLKMSIAPDAATLISQGDTLVLETHGTSTELSAAVMKVQAVMREKFREVQHAKSKNIDDLGLDQSIESNNNDELKQSPNREDEKLNKKQNVDNIDQGAQIVSNKISKFIQTPYDENDEDALNQRFVQIQVKENCMEFMLFLFIQ